MTEALESIGIGKVPHSHITHYLLRDSTLFLEQPSCAADVYLSFIPLLMRRFKGRSEVSRVTTKSTKYNVGYAETMVIMHSYTV